MCYIDRKFLSFQVDNLEFLREMRINPIKVGFFNLAIDYTSSSIIHIIVPAIPLVSLVFVLITRILVIFSSLSYVHLT